MPLHAARTVTRFLLLLVSVALLLAAAAVPAAGVEPTVSAPSEPTGVAPYRFSWASPTRAKPAVNGYHGGAVVTVRFSLGANRGMNVLAQGWPRSQRYYCSTGGLVPNSQYYTRPFGGNGLSYSSATGLYTYSWETREEWAGTCRQFQLKLADGSSIKRADYRIATFRWVRPTLRWHVNQRIAGSTVPVTFSLGGNRGTGIFASGFPKSQRTDCTTGALVANTLEQTSPAGAAGLSYDASSQVYSYRWATKSAWAGTCRQFQLRHPDGSTQLLRYRFAQPGPVVTTSSGSTAYAENASGVPVDPALSVTDADDTNLESATARISSGFQAGDALVFGDQNGISGAYDSGTGVLTLTGTASVANYQAALRSVAFRSSHDHPATARIVAFTAHDGSASSSPASKSLAITRVNDAPTLDTTDTALAYAEGDSPTPVDPGITLTDPDSASLSGATVQITGNFVSAEDALSFATANGINGSYNASTGTLTLSGTASRANYQSALRAVKYANSSDTPSTATRTVSFQADDGAAANDLSNVATRDISMGVANDAPVVTASSGSTHYTEGDPATTIDNALTVTDADDTDLTSATVSLVAAGFQAGDELVFVDQNGITGAYETGTGTGVLTLTGPASVSDFQTALRSVVFRHTGDAPSASKTVRFRVHDGDTDSNAASKAIAVTGANDAPLVTTSSGTAAYTEGGSPVAVDPALTVGDPDSTSISGATAQITSNFSSAEDALSFVNGYGITGSYNASTGTLTLTGAASVADYQTALRSVKYANSSDAPSTATRTVSFQVDDGAAANDLSNVATRDVTVGVANDPPVVTASTGSAPYTEGGSPAMIDDALTVSDADDTHLESATVRITSGFQAGDFLFYFSNNTPAISGIYHTGTGVLTLTGPASVSDFQAALRSVTFGTSNQAPVASKTLEFKVNDGDADSNTPTRELAVTAVNDAPVNSVPGGPIVAVQDTDTEVVGVSVSDRDAGTDDVQLTLSAEHGTLTVDTAVTGGVSAAQVTGNGTKSVVLTAPQEALNATLAADDGLVYHGDAAYVGSDAITVAASDLGHTGTGGTLTDTDTIPVNAVPPNAPPVAQGQTGASAVTTDEDTAKTITLSATDAEGANMTFSVVTAPQHGTLDTLTPTASCDALTPRTCTAQVIYTPDTNYNGADSFSFKANDGAADSQAATVDITVSAVNDAPVNTLPGMQTFDEDTSRTFSAGNGNALSIADVDAGSADVTVTLTTSAGTISAGTPAGGTRSGNGTGNVTLTGSVTELNAALDGLVLTPTGNVNGAHTIGVVSNDGGATGSGGSKSDSDTVSLSISAVNDAPTNTVPAAQQVDEDTDLVFSSGNGNVISVADVDAGANDVRVTLAATNGVTSLGSTTGLTFSAGDGTGDAAMTFDGTVAEVNAALASVTFRGTSNYFGPAQLALTVNDQGHTGGGSLSDSDTIGITVNPVNDAPVADDETFNGNDSAIGNTAMIVNDPDDGAPALTTPKTSISGDILAGDTDVDGPGPLTITPGTFATNDGGSVTIESDGDFTFHPAAGTSCTDASDFFDYTVEDSGSPEQTDTGRVTIAIAACVWYVNNLSAGGPGTSTHPFRTLGEATTVSTGNQTVFVFDGDNTTTGYDAGYGLADGTRLIGEHEGLVVDPDGGGPLAADTLHPANPGAHPTLTATNRDVIVLGRGNEIRGFVLDPAGTGGGIYGPVGRVGGRFDDVIVVDNGTAGSQPALELDGTTGTFAISNFVVSNKATGIRLNNAGEVDFAGDTSQISITSNGGPALVAAGTNMGTSHFDDITVTGSAGGGVSLTNTTGSTVLGDGFGTDLDLTTSSGATAAFALNNAGSVTVGLNGTDNVRATGGPAIDVTGTSGATLEFDAVDSSNSASDGINLDGLGTGTFSAASGTITGAAGISVDLSGGSGDVTYPGTFSNGEGQTAEITGRTGGIVALSGPITESGDIDSTPDNGGISLSGNTGGATLISHATKTFNTGEDHAVVMSNSNGHTLTLSGGTLDIDVTSGKGLEADDSGTLEVSGPGNTITSTTGTALSVRTTDIAAGGLTFRDVSANGAANGIVLDTTGTSGGLTITGDGSSVRNSSGGTIRNIVGADGAVAGNGVYLNNTRDVSLSHMQLNDFQNSAVRGIAVHNFTFAHSTINGTTGNADNQVEAPLSFGAPTGSSTPPTSNGLTGTALVTNSSISGGRNDNISVNDQSGTLALTVTGSTVGPNSVASGNHGLTILAQASTNSPNVTLVVTNSTFTSNKGMAIAVNIGGTSSANVDVSNSTFNSNGFAVGLATNHSADLQYDIHDNPSILRSGSNAIQVLAAVGSTTASRVAGKIRNNVIGDNTVESGSQTAYGIALEGNSSPDFITSVTGNTIKHTDQNGIFMQFRDETNLPGTGLADVTIRNNSIGTIDDNTQFPFFHLYGVHVHMRYDFIGCLDMAGNTSSHVGSGASDFKIDQSDTSTFKLERFTGSGTNATAVANHVKAENPYSGVTAEATFDTGFTGVATGTCREP